MKDYEEEYEKFWKGIIEKDGDINLDQVKRELFDFLMIMKNAGKVYCHITGGEVSKPNTSSDIVIAIHDKLREQQIKEAIEDEKEELEAMKTKRCDGCEFYGDNYSSDDCDTCSRNHEISDKHKPKEQL